MEAVLVAEQWWAIALASLLIVLSRLAFVLWYTGKPLHSISSTSSRREPVRTLIVLGSGGHTAEMLNLVAVLNKERFYPRWYIAATTDNMSLARAQVAEEAGMEQVILQFNIVFFHGRLQIKASGNIQTTSSRSPSISSPRRTQTQAGCKTLQVAKYMQIYRSREVGQSYLTSIVTTLAAMVHATWLIFKIRPDVILCNGPGTCIPLCVTGFGLKVFGIKWVTIFYIESIARVRKLSLSGLLLYKLHFADQIFVQWPELKKKYPKAQYVGRLM